jgi:hypothetical protein
MSSVNHRTDNKNDDDKKDEEEDDALIPGTMLTERQARMLRHAVIIMGVTLVAGFALLIGIIAWRASQPAKTRPVVAPLSGQNGIPIPAGQPLASTGLPTGVPRRLTGLIPRGAKLLETKISGDRLLLTLQTRQRNLKLILIDLKSWQITGEALLKPGH